MNLVRRLLRKVMRLRREDGQAAFEFLLILPIVIPVILLTVDLGILMYEYVSVANGVRQGARYASVNCGTGTCTLANVETWTINGSGGILSTGDTFNIGWPSGVTRGSPVIVQATHPYHFLFFPATIDVTSCTAMTLEQQDNGTGLPAGSLTSC